MRTYASVDYQRSIKECALAMIEQGGFTAREFAQKCGFKLTPHLRKHLRNLVVGGWIQSVQSYTDTGRMATYFIKPIPASVQTQEPLPF
jgi:response regulator of citrate/malate metabolism